MIKQITYAEVSAMVKDGDTIMTGGFLQTGVPDGIIDALVASGVKDLTIICNDPGRPETGVGKLISNKQVKKLILSHMRLNQVAIDMMNAGEIQVELVPQGTLAERIRSGGAGLGGVLTATGLGTEIAKGKPTIELNGKTYLVETPLYADVALIAADTVDTAGNLLFYGTGRNFNPIMAMAAKIVIAEACNVMDDGFIPPDSVHTPGIFVNHYVKGGKN